MVKKTVNLATKFQEKLTIASTSEITHGARNVFLPEDSSFSFQGLTVPNLNIDNIRFVLKDWSQTLKFDKCHLSGLRVSKSDLDHCGIYNGALSDTIIAKTSLFGFSIAKCKINNLKIDDSFFGLHVWDRETSAGVDLLATALDEYLPEGMDVVQSPYASGSNLYASLEGNEGEDVEINRPFGGYAHVGLVHNNFNRFKMTGPGMFINATFDYNTLINSSISDIIFYGGSFECNKLASTPITRCAFINNSLMGSVIELTPQILSSRFINCELAQDPYSNSFRMVDDAIFFYKGRAVLGVMADPDTGFFVPDLQKEEEYRNPSPELLAHLEFREVFTGFLSEALKQTPGNEHVDFQYMHAGLLQAIPFSTIYPELLKQAKAMDLIPPIHPYYREKDSLHGTEPDARGNPTTSKLG